MATDADTNLVGLRDRLRELAGAEAGQAVWDTIRDALVVTKTAWVNCPTCSKRLPAEVKDAQAAVNAAKVLLEQLEGRPGVAPDDDRQQIVIRRHVRGIDCDCQSGGTHAQNVPERPRHVAATFKGP